MVISLSGNNTSQPTGEGDPAPFSSPSLCLDQITPSSDNNARAGVLKAECREKLEKKKEKEGERKKKKKDFTCHLHSTRLGLTAVLFNSSDTLAAKKLDKRTDSEEGKEGGMHN